MIPELTIIPQRVGYIALCSEHGHTAAVWADPIGAALDALGHAAHHHAALPSDGPHPGDHPT